MSAPDFPMARLIQALREARFQFRAGEFNPTLTYDMVSRLVDAQSSENLDVLVERISTFADDFGEKLEGVLNRDYPSLLTQPESILIFMMIEDDIYICQEMWDQGDLPNGLLEKMANAWGKRLPSPL